MLTINQKKNGTLDMLDKAGRIVARCQTLTDANMLRPVDDYAAALVSIAQIQENEGNEPDFEALYFKQRALALQALLRPGK